MKCNDTVPNHALVFLVLERIPALWNSFYFEMRLEQCLLLRPFPLAKTKWFRIK